MYNICMTLQYAFNILEKRGRKRAFLPIGCLDSTKNTLHGIIDIALMHSSFAGASSKRIRELSMLCVKIKVELHLPYLDYGAHCFRGRGYYYVLDDIDNRSLEQLVGEEPNYFFFSDIWWSHKRVPSKRFRRSTERVRLKYAFTVKGSAINYRQISPNGWNEVRCTLIDRY